MKYLLIAIDLDGTLLSNEKEVDDYSIKAIREFEKRGGQVVICSGRTPLATKWIAETLELKSPIISLNGAVTHNRSGSLIEKKTFSEESLDTFSLFCSNENVYFHVYDGNSLIIPEENVWNENWIEKNILSLQKTGGSQLLREEFMKECHVKVIPHIAEWLRERKSISKIAVFSEQNNLRHLKRKVEKLSGEYEIASSMNYMNLEISPRGTTKGTALETLASRLGIPMDQIAAIGDNFNDISMLQCAGRGIAMGNAPDEVKSMADQITASNEENGVGKAIYSLI
ncbi:Cof-type HAD-IIB family hydrolase [Domibacillus iocasae]|uniref:Hydrolase n=1 Tax=Domibacillus iocasae TaxID=1714016 RepID=A0A1E7DNP0_9BACI|nr:Cof-type HAD-IIB family hydrolase [Domibacillus iocasae]OES44691.1 hypothetical protein BA724_05265 [Domibacillus iocasae]